MKLPINFSVTVCTWNVWPSQLILGLCHQDMATTWPTLVFSTLLLGIYITSMNTQNLMIHRTNGRCVVSVCHTHYNPVHLISVPSTPICLQCAVTP